MAVFISLIWKIIPLYLIIGAGYLAGRYYQVSKESVSSLVIYVVAPAVVFLGTMRAGLEFNLLILPVVSFVVASVFCGVYYYCGKFLWKDATRYLLAFSAGNGNTGYFGVPLCLAILGDQALPVVVMFTLGMILFENSLGYYVFARSEEGAKEALKRLLKLPSLYAFVIGMALNISGATIAAVAINTMEILKGAYAPLGMMIVGLGLAGVRFHHLDKLFIGISLVQKFLVYPAVMLLVIYWDGQFWHFFTPLIRAVLIIESVVPLAANTVAFGSRFRAHPEKAAITVMISNFVALAVMPIAIALLVKEV